MNGTRIAKLEDDETGDTPPGQFVSTLTEETVPLKIPFRSYQELLRFCREALGFGIALGEVDLGRLTGILLQRGIGAYESAEPMRQYTNSLRDAEPRSGFQYCESLQARRTRAESTEGLEALAAAAACPSLTTRTGGSRTPSQTRRTDRR